MLQLVYRNYRIGNQKQNKKAAIISFTEPVTASNVKEYRRQLKDVVDKNYDSYIFYIKKPEHMSAHELHIMVAFSNSYTGKTGLLIKETRTELFDSLPMHTIFVLGSDIKTILINLERAG
ncbi:MAG: hypothetical protein JXJ04_01575 [Spirochaetales bacterium]|nr:hypothetical protein [Spirochaetales bacterium]